MFLKLDLFARNCILNEKYSTPFLLPAAKNEIVFSN